MKFFCIFEIHFRAYFHVSAYYNLFNLLINGLAILSGSKSSEVPTSDLVKIHKIKYGVNEITSIIGIPIIGFE